MAGGSWGDMLGQDRAPSAQREAPATTCGSQLHVRGFLAFQHVRQGSGSVTVFRLPVSC